jgi:ketosteroid isomerase-like protein
MRWTHVVTVHAGKITAFEEYVDLSALVAELKASQSRL